MLNYIKKLVPQSVKDGVKGAFGELYYLEYHLTDHCNLNCKGCGHFCNLSDPSFADLGRYTSDIRRLAQVFSNIRTVRLLGGEPLLHSNPIGFIEETHASFPRTSIWFVTNGILLTKASAQFWETCRNANVVIHITGYPPFEKLVPRWQALCRKEGLTVCIDERREFFAHMNFDGDSDKTEAFRFCRATTNCPYLRNGRIYLCAMTAHIELFNKKYNTQIIGDAGIDLFDPNVSARKIMKYLNTPIDTCRWCATQLRYFPWSTHKKNELVQQSDWNAMG